MILMKSSVLLYIMAMFMEKLIDCYYFKSEK